MTHILHKEFLFPHLIYLLEVTYNPKFPDQRTFQTFFLRALYLFFFTDFCPTLVSLTPEMNFRTLSASMINQESNSAAIIPLLTLKLSLVSTLVNHHTKNREKIPGILLNFYLLIIKQERITVCLANPF